MTQLPSPSSEKPSENSNSPPTTPVIPADGPNTANKVSQKGPRNTRSLAARRSGSQWCRAAILTVLIVLGSYLWLSWTDPDQVEMRKQAWEAAMEKIRGKQVVYANRYSKEHRFRPAASPIITEVLPDGRKKIKGARHGDDIPIPKPTGTAAAKKQRKRRHKKKN
ncbi:hypothetical protein M408DRAFT_333638 [Serendipita vermifera MAFF 305830]|uniref:Transmembrane protein n=2 Tax=Serendipita vermifera MAFF 305830 TaxID=933852 RepID=A0A0C3A947_SERVB|nr:hypothetical protein M408DRAFT_333638 [Serendipita vermifera MAFF 305830]